MLNTADIQIPYLEM